MHGRRSIIKRRDDDDLTLTRPLSKRVSFSANNHTRVFTVDSDESKHTTFGPDHSSVALTPSTTYTQQSLNGTSLMESLRYDRSDPWTVSGLSGPSGMMEETFAADDDKDRWLEDSDEEESATSEVVAHDAEAKQLLEEGDDREESILEENVQEESKSAVSEPQGLLPLPASACRTSSEHDDKTNLMELGDESTGVVRDELRKVAEELLPSQTKSELDIYGIKATLHGRSQRKRQKEDAKPVHEYTFANNTITGIRFSNIMPEVTIIDECSRYSPHSSIVSARSARNSDTRESPNASIEHSLPSENSSVNNNDSTLEESAMTASMSAAEESAELSCGGTETMNRTDGMEDGNHSDGSMEENAYDDHSGEGDASQANMSLEPSVMTAPSCWENEGVSAASSAEMNRTSTSVNGGQSEDATSCETLECSAASDDWVDKSEDQRDQKDVQPESMDQSDSLAKSEEGDILLDDDKPADEYESIDKVRDPTFNETLSQPGVDRQFDVSGVHKLDDSSSELLPSDQAPVDDRTNDSHPRDATFTKGRLSSRLSAVADGSLQCRGNDSSRRGRVTDVVNKTYSVHESASEEGKIADITSLTDREVSCLANELEPSFQDHSHSISVSGVLSQPLPIAEKTSMAASGPFRPTSARKASVAKNVNVDDVALYKKFPELFEGLTSPPVWELPSVPPPPTCHINLGMDSAALKKALFIEENKDLKASLKKELDDLHAVRDGFHSLISRLEEALERATAPPFIDPDRLENVAPPQDVSVESDFERKTACVSYSKYGFPFVKIECAEQANGTVTGRVLSCEDDFDEEPSGVFALVPLVVTWARRALVRNSNNIEWTTSSWSEAENRICSAIKLLQNNYTLFEGIEHRLRSHLDAGKGKTRVSFEGMVWRCREMKVFVDADLQDEIEIGSLPEKETSKLYDLRMDEFQAAWKSDGALTFLERINKVHERTMEIAAAQTIEIFQTRQKARANM